MLSLSCLLIFMPPPPWGAGDIMFSGCLSVGLCMRPCVRASGKPCERDKSKSCWGNLLKLSGLVHMGIKMNWLDFGVKGSKVKVTKWPNMVKNTLFELYSVNATLGCAFVNWFRHIMCSSSMYDQLRSKGQMSRSRNGQIWSKMHFLSYIVKMQH